MLNNDEIWNLAGKLSRQVWRARYGWNDAPLASVKEALRLTIIAARASTLDGQRYWLIEANRAFRARAS